uniref:Uncharacterized protein C6orf132 n=1 Tax=Anthurium amnicola TaxID=1678845 RepID=A0A1D1XL99_9ARAE
MEMLVVVAQHQNYGGGGKLQIADGFMSPPSRGFRGINCRTFQSDVGILPSPCPETVPSASPRAMKQQQGPFLSEPPTQPRRSNPISINSMPRPSMSGASFNDQVSDSERWAGPAYSNSPPPSSLPIPKFSLCQKRSLSPELPVPSSGNKVHPVAKSAPSSPNRESYSYIGDFFFNTNSATQDLRRILHLDVADDLSK